MRSPSFPRFSLGGLAPRRAELVRRLDALFPRLRLGESARPADLGRDLPTQEASGVFGGTHSRNQGRRSRNNEVESRLWRSFV